MLKDGIWTPDKLISDSVIFLDVDGVLNGRGTKERLRRYIFVEPSKIEIVRQLAEATGAQVVLSSSWRIDAVNEGRGYVNSGYNIFIPLIEELEKYGVHIIDVTTQRYMGRGRECWDYCLQHPTIKHIILLDDEIDTYPLHEYQFKTSYEGVVAMDEFEVDIPYGLYPEALPKMIEMLQRDFVCPTEDEIGWQYDKDELVGVGNQYGYGDMKQYWSEINEDHMELFAEETRERGLKGQTLTCK